jgi:glycosyltransferase involved in cell wall biosynthesis
MLALLDVLAAGPFESTVVCNLEADANNSSIPVETRAIPTWRFGSLRYPAVIARAVDALRPGVVHVQQELFLYGQGPGALLFPLLLRRLQRKHRVVVTVHGVTTDREIDASLMRGRRSPVPLSILRAVIVGIFRAIARSGAHLIVHDGILKERLIALGARDDKVSVIAHPLFSGSEGLATMTPSAARRRLGLPENAKIVLTWGYWNGYKGLDVLAEGFERFAEGQRDAILILGTGPHPQLREDKAYLASYAAEMNALSSHPAVRHVGFIADEQLPEYVRAADVCAFAYTKYLAASGPATYALTLGSPVLYSSVFRDVPEVMSFDASPQGVDDALQRFFENPQPYAAAARELRDRAAAGTLLAQYEELYRRVNE